MQRCQKCGAIFPRQLRVGDRRLDLRGRKHCLDCRPHRALRGPRKAVLRPAKQLTCELCGTIFAAKQVIAGKLRSLYRRRFCLEWANCHRLRHAREAAQDVARVVELRRELKMRAVALFGGACRGCGCSYAPAAFDFHHLDAGAKGYGISSDGIYRSWEETLQELRKCVMLCANCHAEVHAGV